MLNCIVFFFLIQSAFCLLTSDLETLERERSAVPGEFSTHNVPNVLTNLLTSISTVLLLQSLHISLPLRIVISLPGFVPYCQYFVCSNPNSTIISYILLPCNYRMLPKLPKS